ncbi:FAD-dependent oxidoreductase [Variovorax arabinosiphilus]|uniref:FAD-dependent oxidoreductase n=1 Tax=Variovorax arabinosiphilus TaxID=3053498 RepID=UPI00257601C7|nr:MULTISPECIES: FAD-dependent oxidoreductase [unclassified Variovorax]MDM0122596.1 FAD-dependent oxidoreductase [Variovorax sp. J2L1-78]MDM0130875.1 FAD-dependent oxidoreductase [Variovorax sp. J2L1-63]MDM0235359.1 FAD-dependent oxidoreductase [Variovorax sp. J2R1-6]
MRQTPAFSMAPQRQSTKLAEVPVAIGVETDYQALEFRFKRSPDQDLSIPARRPVVVVGAGPVGLSLAIDLAQRGVPVTLLDDDFRLSAGSRAICFAKRTLEIFDRLGCGDQMVGKGVSWNLGRVFFGDEQIYQFDLLPEEGHERPAFINLQQYYVEGFLCERAAQLPLVDLRWRNKVSGVEQRGDHVMLSIDTPDGPYQLAADHLVACDGSRSTVRQLIGEESKGKVFRDRFLIADVKMKLEQPAERWFWFDPPFHRNQSVLLHMQPDGVWRIDFQLGWDADPIEEKKPENIIPRVKQMLAHTSLKDAEFELEWASVYTFACLRMDKFRVGRTIFAGDAAHGVSPFGARGANSGVQDAENLAWKLAAVMQNRAPDALLDTYAMEREYAADENILNSTRATDFITPKSEVSRLFRDAVLDLARTHTFARSLVNSGRLSTPTTLAESPLNTPVQDGSFERMVPGAPATDAPVRRFDGEHSWLLRELGPDFTALVCVDDTQSADVARFQEAARAVGQLKVLSVARSAGVAADLIDAEGLLAKRYEMQPGSVVLLRPDQHVCARGNLSETNWLGSALHRALAVN